MPALKHLTKGQAITSRGWSQWDDLEQRMRLHRQPCSSLPTRAASSLESTCQWMVAQLPDNRRSALIRCIEMRISLELLVQQISATRTGEKNLVEFDNALNPRVKIADWSRCPTLDISGLKVAWAMGVSTPDVYTIVWKFACNLDYHTA